MTGHMGGHPLPGAGNPGPMPRTPGAYVPLPQGADPRATPPPPAPGAGGGGTLAALLVGQGALVLGFFVLAIVATWIRAERGAEPTSAPATPTWSEPQAPNVAPSSGEWIAVVSNAKGMPGVIRSQPSTKAEPHWTVPLGTEVEVLDAREAGRKWYRVRTRGRLPVLGGWMHGDILRPK